MELVFYILISVTIALNAVLGLFVYLKNRHDRVSQSFLILMGTFIVWAFLITVLHTTNDLEFSSFLARVVFFVALLLGWAFLMFSSLFPIQLCTLSRPASKLGVVLSIVSAVILFMPGGVVVQSFVGYFGKSYVLNFYLYSIYVVTILYFFVWSFIILFRKLCTFTGDHKALVMFFLFSTTLPVAITITFALLTYYIAYYDFSDFTPVMSLFFTIPTYYLLFVRSR